MTNFKIIIFKPKDSILRKINFGQERGWFIFFFFFEKQARVDFWGGKQDLKNKLLIMSCLYYFKCKKW